ncbi:MAG: phage virion morphogenesis protein [Magnetococcales bacterium]|nr:phage virion morphogenesis protein [Magnetococcales bacterium]
MAGVLFQIDSDSAEELQEALSKLADRCRNLTPCLKDIGENLVRSTDQRFDAFVAPDGTRWEDNAPLTEEKKKGRFGEGKILTDSGRLRRSITYSTAYGGLLVGTDVIYAATHQFGGETPQGKKIPARPFLGLSDRDKDSALEIIAEYLSGALS